MQRIENQFVLPNGVASAAMPLVSASPQILTLEESTSLGRVSENRRREFAGGRRCAKEALGTLGIPCLSLLRGPNRDPAWPRGVVGSISHGAGFCAAAVARSSHLAFLGIDIERAGAVDDEFSSLVLRSDEVELARHLMEIEPSVHWLTLFFSAKEAAFKAIFPALGKVISFEQMRITFNQDGGFWADVLIEDCGVKRFDALRGQTRISTGRIWTAAWIEHNPGTAQQASSDN